MDFNITIGQALCEAVHYALDQFQSTLYLQKVVPLSIFMTLKVNFHLIAEKSSELQQPSEAGIQAITFGLKSTVTSGNTT